MTPRTRAPAPSAASEATGLPVLASGLMLLTGTSTAVFVLPDWMHVGHGPENCDEVPECDGGVEECPTEDVEGVTEIECCTPVGGKLLGGKLCWLPVGGVLVGGKLCWLPVGGGLNVRVCVWL